jgi:hypothetical protein
MDNKTEYREEIRKMYQDLYRDERKRESSIQQSASRLLVVEGAVLGLLLIASLLSYVLRTASTIDKCGILACAAILFAAMLVAVLAQWHPSRDSIANADNIQVQLEEAPESFQTHEDRVQYELELYQKLTADLQHTSHTLNNRLRASGITFLAGTGLWILVLALNLFGI